MSPERRTLQEPKSEICADPEILLKKIRSLFEHSGDKTDECKKMGGKDVSMEILFVADSEKRNDLIGLSINVKNDGSTKNSGTEREYYEVKVSPELRIKKFNPGK